MKFDERNYVMICDIFVYLDVIKIILKFGKILNIKFNILRNKKRIEEFSI